MLIPAMSTNNRTCVSFILYFLIHICVSEFITQPKDITYFVGEKAKLNCTFSSTWDKDETHYWIKDSDSTGTEYISRDTELNSKFSETKYSVCICGRSFRLEISNLTDKDAGLYYCGIPNNRTNTWFTSQTMMLNVIPSTVS